MDETRVGLGLDVHPRDQRRSLYLGGVLFEGEPGLAGHSDADVVCHAVADALLGAAGLGDLGEHFPDSDPEFAGLAGLDLLARVVGLLEEARIFATGCDLTVVAERPAIAGVRGEIRHNLSRVLKVAEPRVSVKATRPEGLGLTGDGAACLAVVSVRYEPA